MVRTLLALLALAVPAFAQSPGKRYALLVGGNKYENRNLPELNFAEADVKDLADYLKVGGYEIAILLGSAEGEQRASKANIEANLEAILKRTTKDDTLIVALAGHGLQFAKPGGKEEAYFCPREAVPSEVDTLVSLSALLKRIGERGAGTNLILVDACRNDPDPNRSGIDGNAMGNLPEGTAILFSCARGQKAIESSKAQHGLFFHFVLDGLKGEARNKKGEITWDRLVASVKERVPSEGPDLVAAGIKVTQTPHGISNLASTGVLLSGVAASTPPAAPPPVEAGPEVLLKRGLATLHGVGVKRDPKAGFALIREAAEQGLARAQYHLGEVHDCGYGATVVREAEAIQWYRKAADAGDPLAQAEMAVRRHFGNGVAKSADDAQKEMEAVLPKLREFADAGNARAQEYLSAAAATGLGLDQDGAASAEWARKAAERGDPWAMLRLGQALLHGDGGLDVDPVEGGRWCRKAADLELAAALCQMGACYSQGVGFDLDAAEAVKWYRKAAEAGSPDGMLQLGGCYENGTGVDADAAEAVKWYRKAADTGDAEAMNLLGNRYNDGSNVPQDFAEAVKWYRKAAEAGHVLAMYNLGNCYETGEGVDADAAEAVKWYRMSADGDCPEGMNALGTCYENGVGVDKDPAEAFAWYQKAHDLGNDEATCNLGQCYFLGSGVERDQAKAVELYRTTADAGLARGQRRLGECYENGTGIEKNLDEAIAWYRKAADGGDQEAKDALIRLKVDPNTDAPLF